MFACYSHFFVSFCLQRVGEELSTWHDSSLHGGAGGEHGYLGAEEHEDLIEEKHGNLGAEGHEDLIERNMETLQGLFFTFFYIFASAYAKDCWVRKFENI